MLLNARGVSSMVDGSRRYLSMEGWLRPIGWLMCHPRWRNSSSTLNARLRTATSAGRSPFATFSSSRNCTISTLSC